MSQKKYRLTDEKIEYSGRTLFRIEALVDFGSIKKGALGGFIEKEENLCQEVYGNAWVSGNARVYGNAEVYGDARVYGNAKISFGYCKFDISQNLIGYISCSLHIFPIGGKYYLYKKVKKMTEGKYCSTYDESFVYEDGKIMEAKNPDLDVTKSCSSGLHVSTPFYWEDGDSLIAVEVAVEDVITCQEGKLRVKKLKVIGEIKEFQGVKD